jgi:hypothetical protein
MNLAEFSYFTSPEIFFMILPIPFIVANTVHIVIICYNDILCIIIELYISYIYTVYIIFIFLSTLLLSQLDIPTPSLVISASPSYPQDTSRTGSMEEVQFVDFGFETLVQSWPRSMEIHGALALCFNL